MTIHKISITTYDEAMQTLWHTIKSHKKYFGLLLIIPGLFVSASLGLSASYILGLEFLTRWYLNMLMPYMDISFCIGNCLANLQLFIDKGWVIADLANGKIQGYYLSLNTTLLLCGLWTLIMLSLPFLPLKRKKTLMQTGYFILSFILAFVVVDSQANYLLDFQSQNPVIATLIRHWSAHYSSLTISTAILVTAAPFIFQHYRRRI